MDITTRMFQQSLCESRSLVDNLDPTSARLVNDLQKQISKLKRDIETEKLKCRHMAQDHLAELKRLREEHERRLESSLEALNLRKDNEKAAELKKLEEQILRQKDQEIRHLNKEKIEELKSLERRLQKQFNDKLRFSIEQEHRLAFEEAQSRLPGEDELIARETKLAKEVFSLGDENYRLEDQVKNLSQENKSLIDLLRRSKQEHQTEFESLLRQNKSEAARDNARLRLAEQIIQEKESEFMDISHRAEVAEQECEELRVELSQLKTTLQETTAASNKKKKGDDTSPQLSRQSAPLLKQIEELEYSVKKLEEDKADLKQENASLRKKLVQDTEAKQGKEVDDRMKRLRKRNADLVTLTKTLDERCKVLKLENTKLQEKQTSDNSEVEQQIRRTLARQHAKDISDYTRKIATRDREIQEMKRKLSKFEVTSGPALESASEVSKKMKSLSMEKLRMEKLITKLYNQLPNCTDVELKYKEFSSEAARLQELSEENDTLRRQLNELQLPSDIDGKIPRKPLEPVPTSSLSTELDVVREMRDENQKLQTQLEDLSKIEKENKELANELTDMQLAASSSEKKLKLLEEDLDQARALAQDLERVQEHCIELEKEVTETRGLLNEKDTEICQLELENKTCIARVQEKDEEIQCLKEQVSSLKNELSQGETLVNELQQELDLANQLPEQIHTAMQTSPLYSPKTYPKGIQTSPLASPKTSPKTGATFQGKLEHVPEIEGENDTDTSGLIAQAKVENVFNMTGPPSDLHSEMQAVGISISDPYDSEGPVLSDENTSELPSTTSLSSPEKTPRTSDVVLTKDTNTPSKPHPLDGEPASLYIACDDYNPLIMSPNPDHEVELTLKQGDYVYVYGTIDDDGFFTARLSDGKEGLVPCNYVQKLADEAFPFSPGHTHNTTPLSHIPPPINLELTRQFVENNAYCLAIHWEHPKPLPQDISGYNVYVNGKLDSTIEPTAETFVLLSDIPRNEYICVSVKTVTGRGESTDPLKPIEINPQYPETPSRLSLQLVSSQPLLFRLLWFVVHYSPKRHSSCPPVLSYNIYLNQSLLVKSVLINQLGKSPDGSFFIDLKADDFQQLTLQDSTPLTTPLSLSIQACSEHYISVLSTSVELPNNITKVVCPNVVPVEEGPQISTSLLSIEGTTSVSSILSNGAIESFTDGSQSGMEGEITEVIIGGYYRALYCYDPSVSSPNEDGANDELTFEDNDIIVALGNLDEDGFFMGECNGNQGLVPKNMVEHITDPKELANITEKLTMLLKKQKGTSDVSNCNHVGGQRLVQALYDYDPFHQSPNEDPSEELEFHEGDYITIFGDPDEDGFYEGELKGQRGLVPKQYVTLISGTTLMSNLMKNDRVSPPHILQQPTIET